MEEIKTGIYKTVSIRLPKKELTISKKNLELEIKKIDLTIQKREKTSLNIGGFGENIERLKRMKQTAQMLIEGYVIEEIANELDLKYSTIENYIKYLGLNLNPKP
ncbi:hypothetical protein J4411_02230 [Candidatus Pacearchaeota archaeon]|nr:hypothetical protein [Candidatus Pacearchaeota archaeon]